MDSQRSEWVDDYRASKASPAPSVDRVTTETELQQDAHIAAVAICGMLDVPKTQWEPVASIIRQVFRAYGEGEQPARTHYGAHDFESDSDDPAKCAGQYGVLMCGLPESDPIHHYVEQPEGEGK